MSLARSPDGWRAYAYNKLRQAINRGDLLPANWHMCVDCGEQAYGWEHRDYRKPLEVEPCCQKCNIRRGPGLPLTRFQERQQARKEA